MTEHSFRVVFPWRHGYVVVDKEGGCRTFTTDEHVRPSISPPQGTWSERTFDGLYYLGKMGDAKRCTIRVYVSDSIVDGIELNAFERGNLRSSNFDSLDEAKAAGLAWVNQVNHEAQIPSRSHSTS